MGETPMFSAEFIFAIILVAAVVLLVVRQAVSRRLQQLEDTVRELAEENKRLQQMVQKQEENRPDSAAAVTETQVLQKEMQSMVPVGQRQLSVVESPAVSAPAVQAEETVPDVVVAVIMAAIASLGYAPSSVRAIKPAKTRRSGYGWVMAGRMANMK